jgi:putative flippase GtrA
MIGKIRKLLEDERVRFLIIGGINTVVGYVIFALLQLAFGRYIHYLGSLYISYVPSVLLAFYLHRKFTFRAAGSGNVFLDLARFASVYIVSLVVNTILLPVLVEWLKFNPYAAQALIVIAVTLISYLGHKFFSFRRPPTTESPGVGH